MIHAVVGQARPGSIIIFHINGRGWKTHEALLAILRGLRGRGFRFVSLSELLKPSAVAAAAWWRRPRWRPCSVGATPAARPWRRRRAAPVTPDRAAPAPRPLDRGHGSLADAGLSAGGARPLSGAQGDRRARLDRPGWSRRAPGVAVADDGFAAGWLHRAAGGATGGERAGARRALSTESWPRFREAALALVSATGTIAPRCVSTEVGFFRVGRLPDLVRAGNVECCGNLPASR